MCMGMHMHVEVKGEPQEAFTFKKKQNQKSWVSGPEFAKQARLASQSPRGTLPFPSPSVGILSECYNLQIIFPLLGVWGSNLGPHIAAASV